MAVKVDGKELEKDNQVSVGPGTKIEFGDEAVFQASACTSARSCMLVSSQSLLWSFVMQGPRPGPCLARASWRFLTVLPRPVLVDHAANQALLPCLLLGCIQGIALATVYTAVHRIDPRQRCSAAQVERNAFAHA